MYSVGTSRTGGPETGECPARLCGAISLQVSMGFHVSTAGGRSDSFINSEVWTQYDHKRCSQSVCLFRPTMVSTKPFPVPDGFLHRRGFTSALSH
jgi:hypothetical protein